MNKGLRRDSFLPYSLHNIKIIWIWDLMNKGLRLRSPSIRGILITLSESETWWIRDWDFTSLYGSIDVSTIWIWDLMNKGLRLIQIVITQIAYISSESETWWIRDWDRFAKNGDIQIQLSESETWWIRDWDAAGSSQVNVCVTVIWIWDLMNKGLRLILTSLWSCSFWYLNLRPDE